MNDLLRMLAASLPSVNLTVFQATIRMSSMMMRSLSFLVLEVVVEDASRAAGVIVLLCAATGM